MPNLTETDPQQHLPEVHFEPGWHAMTQADYDKYLKASEHGNPNANEWNQAVTTRIHSYKPSIVAVDSLSSVGKKEEDYTLEMKADVWRLLPDRPTRLNGTDEIFVLAGDNTYNFNVKNGQWNDSLTAKMISILGLTMAFTAADYTGKLADGYVQRWRQWQVAYDPTTGSYDNEAASKVSRRQFFQYAGVSAAALALFGSPKIAAFSPWSSVTQVAETVDEATEFVRLDRRLGERTYTDGRTALLIAKTFDALEQITDINRKVGTVVMGNGHIPFNDELLRDPAKRANFIHRHTASMCKATIDIPFYSDETSAITVAERQQGVYDLETTYTLFRISEPDDKRFKQDPSKEIDRIVQYAGSFTAPSVADAVKDLRPPEKAS